MKTTITIKSVEFDVEFDYQPEEKAVTYYPDGSGYPGCAESIDGINSIKCGDVEFLEFFEDDLKVIEEKIWESLKSDQ